MKKKVTASRQQVPDVSPGQRCELRRAVPARRWPERHAWRLLSTVCHPCGAL